MVGIGLGVTFIGYSVFYYGLSQVKGQNFGLLDLVLPTRWSAIVKTQGPVNDDGKTYPLGSSTPSSSPAPASTRPASSKVTAPMTIV